MDATPSLLLGATTCVLLAVGCGGGGSPTLPAPGPPTQGLGSHELTAWVPGDGGDWIAVRLTLPATDGVWSANLPGTLP